VSCRSGRRTLESASVALLKEAGRRYGERLVLPMRRHDIPGTCDDRRLWLR
jgi:hypothetical protein